MGGELERWRLSGLAPLGSFRPTASSVSLGARYMPPLPPRSVTEGILVGHLLLPVPTMPGGMNHAAQSLACVTAKAMCTSFGGVLSWSPSMAVFCRSSTSRGLWSRRLGRNSYGLSLRCRQQPRLFPFWIASRSCLRHSGSIAQPSRRSRAGDRCRSLGLGCRGSPSLDCDGVFAGLDLSI